MKHKKQLYLRRTNIYLALAGVSAFMHFWSAAYFDAFTMLFGFLALINYMIDNE